MSKKYFKKARSKILDDKKSFKWQKVNFSGFSGVRGKKFKKISGPRPYCCKFIKIGYKIFSRRTPVLELPHQIHTHTHTHIYI